MKRKAPLPAARVLLAFCYPAIPLSAQAGTSAQRVGNVSARKRGVFGRTRAVVRPSTSHADRLRAPILTEATEQGVPRRHVQNAIHEFTGPDVDHSQLPAGRADALAVLS